MNFLDIASWANADINIYCLVLILAYIILFPSAIMLGIILAILSSVVSLFTLVVNKGRTNLAFAGWKEMQTGTVVLMFIALVLVSGVCKEIYFRGLAKNFCGSIFGEGTALFLFNVMFGMLD